MKLYLSYKKLPEFADVSEETRESVWRKCYPRALFRWPFLVVIILIVLWVCTSHTFLGYWKPNAGQGYIVLLEEVCRAVVLFGLFALAVHLALEQARPLIAEELKNSNAAEES